MVRYGIPNINYTPSNATTQPCTFHRHTHFRSAMQHTTITSETNTALAKFIDNATQPTTSDPASPAALVHMIDAENNVLFSHGSSPNVPPTASSIAFIQSLTKVIGAVANAQLVERGLATLDDPTTIPTFLPELAAKKVLTGSNTDPEIEKKL